MPIEEREFHPVSALFPLMDGGVFDEFVADIRKHGLREAIWIDEEGRIIDGRNRYRACRRLDIEPRYRVWDGEGSLVAFVLGLNLHRRHLSIAQRAMVAARARPLFREEAEERKLRNLWRGNRPPERANLRARDLEGELRGKSSEHVARIVGVSARSVDTAVKVLNDATPQLTRLVDQGKLAVSAAGEVATLPVSEQLELIELGPEAIRIRARELREERQHRISLPSPRVAPRDLQIRPVNVPRASSGVEGEPAFLQSVEAIAPFFRGPDAEMLLDGLDALGEIEDGRLMAAYDVISTAIHRLQRLKKEIERRARAGVLSSPRSRTGSD